MKRFTIEEDKTYPIIYVMETGNTEPCAGFSFTTDSFFNKEEARAEAQAFVDQLNKKYEDEKS